MAVERQTGRTSVASEAQGSHETTKEKSVRSSPNDGSCICLRLQHVDHVWSYDLSTIDEYRTLNIIDEFSRDCLAIRVKRKLNSTDVIDALTDLFIIRGVPAYIRSDNGPEFIAEAVRQWIKAVGAETVYIEPGSPWENGYCDSFNARFRDELLNGVIFYTLRDAQIVTGSGDGITIRNGRI